MKFVSTDQMRKLDADTISQHGTPGEVLMARAGRGIARQLLNVLRFKGLTHPSVLLAAGKGNNGGDAFVVARLLAESGCRAEVWLAGQASDVKGDARTHLNAMRDGGVKLVELPDEAAWTVDRPGLPLVDLVVDGLLGTGTSGAPRGVVARAIEVVNTLGSEALVAAIDLPSGMNSDTGSIESPCVVADVTYTLGAPKTGLLNEDGWDVTGSVEAVDIGIPEALVEQTDSDAGLTLIDEAFVRSVLPRRPRQTNKSTYGRALLIGGARGYSGAIGLAARGCLAAGAGLITVYTPGSVSAAVAANCPEAMVTGVEETSSGSIAAPLSDALADLSRLILC